MAKKKTPKKTPKKTEPTAAPLQKVAFDELKPETSTAIEQEAPESEEFELETFKASADHLQFVVKKTEEGALAGRRVEPGRWAGDLWLSPGLEPGNVCARFGEKMQTIVLDEFENGGSELMLIAREEFFANGVNYEPGTVCVVIELDYWIDLASFMELITTGNLARSRVRLSAEEKKTGPKPV